LSTQIHQNTYFKPKIGLHYMKKAEKRLVFGKKDKKYPKILALSVFLILSSYHRKEVDQH
jgi:hypothetical protein